MTAAELIPAPHELAAYAATTAGIDRDRLARWLIGHQQAGIPWRPLARIVHLWLLTDGREFHQLDDALRAWTLKNPTRPHGART